MPPLLFLMLGLILFMCLLTYVVPAGLFSTDPETGALLGDSFQLLPANTPVNPWQAINLILKGTQNSAMTIALLLYSGGTIGIILDSGAIDDLVNWAVYKLQDKGIAVLLPVLFILMGLLGAFGGGDQLVAIVPVGVMFAKKLKLDPMMAALVTFFPNWIGFATGPTKLMIPQLMMDLPVYSGFGLRFLTLMVSIFVGLFFTMQYAFKIKKDPTKSAMGNTDWLADLDVEGSELKAYDFDPKAALVVFLFFAQYVVIVYAMTVMKMGNEIMISVQLIVAIVCGFIYGMGGEKISRSFAKGVGGMAFVGVVIGLAGTMSLIMNNGQVLHTIVYYATLPLQGLNKGMTAVGISIVVMFINFFIPSASSKAAILFPIVKPMAEALGITPQVAVSAFQFGDGFTNMITPALGATVGSLEVAKVPFDKWFKWAFIPIIILQLGVWISLYFIALANWTGL